ncbi:hypothetical protein CIPAW_04G193400 [Carya illinoinensis]|uniref:Leucine-rich repeat-containing N-terminal plant-type domain-containing protein n=1 Tax=Carya illinoinensis TaxID=32201 RepID=A0A8T1QWJ0_CARIL|nr:hypothetical protein CIPAW_04G193400 [Carya illinoinensis]
MDIYSYHELIIFVQLLLPLIACLLLLLPRSLSYNYLPPLCHQEERIALMQFKESFIRKNDSLCEYTERNHPAEVASWRIDGNNTNCCVWDGVECNEDTGHVIFLNLSSSCLYGSITSNNSLFRLHHLQNLTLAYNNFNLPNPLDSFYPYLYTKSLTSLVQNLTNLERLVLCDINISSTVHESLANLSSLKVLDLIRCGLYGRFPTRIFQLPHLQELFVVGDKDLTGHLPEFHTNSPLDFSGTIPNSFSNLTQLTWLELSQNSFTGGISPFLCNMSSPKMLDLSYNHLSGMIHPCFGNLNQTSLLVLRLQNNNFGGTIPKTWAKGCLLRMLDLSQNQLQGHFPRSLANCTELEYLHVGHNQINDTYPFWLGTLQQLQILVLHSNGFHGAIRSLETNYTFPNLHIIDLSHNHLSGNLPTGYFAQWDAMKSIGVKNLYYLGDQVYYSITMMIKSVELEYKRIHNDLKVIDFSCNRFEGEIPKQVGNLKGLHVLNLSNNAFTGHIPSSFVNLTQLESLDLSQNKLFGEIPPELVQLNFLSMFNVSHNSLTGPIPHGQQFETFENTSFKDNRGLCGRPLSKICGDSDISTPPPSTNFEENQGPNFFFEFGWKVVVMGYGCGFVFGVVIGHIVTTRKPDLVFNIFGKKQHQTRIKKKETTQVYDRRSKRKREESNIALFFIDA